MAIYKPSLLDKFKDFVNGLKGNWDEYEDHVAEFDAHLEEWEYAKDRSLLQYSSLNQITEFAPNSYINKYHAIQISGESDMNDVRYSGLYYVVASDTYNTPTDVNGYLLVISADAGHCVQMYMTTSLTNYNIYLRKYTTSAGWGDWGTVGS